MTRCIDGWCCRRSRSVMILGSIDVHRGHTGKHRSVFLLAWILAADFTGTLRSHLPLRVRTLLCGSKVRSANCLPLPAGSGGLGLLYPPHVTIILSTTHLRENVIIIWFATTFHISSPGCYSPGPRTARRLLTHNILAMKQCWPEITSSLV